MSARLPADLARETLRLLAQRQLPPTPQNYQAAYEEVARVVPQEAFPIRALRNIASVLPSQTAHQARLARSFSAAIESRDWSALQTTLLGYANLGLGLASPTRDVEADHAQTLPPSLAEQLARLIENTVSALGDEDERLRELSLQLVNFLRQSPPPLVALEQMLHNYSYRLSFNAQEQAERRALIHQHLGLTLQHIRSLATEDNALQQQAQQLETAMQAPWTHAQLDTIGHQLKSFLFRHFELQTQQLEALRDLSQQLSQHAQLLAELSEHQSTPHKQLSESARQVAQSTSAQQLRTHLAPLLEYGKTLVTEQRHIHAQLQDLHEQTDVQESTIHSLTKDLQRLQEISRHDPSSGALNGKGLQETIQMEMARAHRHHAPLSAAVLQLRTTDELLHSLGPQAHDLLLRHFVHVLRSALRPQDALARTPDHRLVLLMPYSTVEQSSQALGRLQTEVAQRPLVHGDNLERLSFSAGVVQLQPHEQPLELLKRAAMAAEQANNLDDASIITG